MSWARARAQRYIAGLLLMLAVGGGGAPRGEDDDALLEFLAAELEQARDRIRSVVYDYEYETVRYVSPKGFTRSVGGGMVKLSGHRCATVFRRRMFMEGADDREVVARAILTPACYAALPYPTNIAVRYERNGGDLQSEDFYGHYRSVCGYDLLKFGFGTGDQMLWEMRADPDRAIRWEVDEERSESGQLVFRLKRYMPIVDDPDVAAMELIADPAQGFMITHFLARTHDGRVGLERSVWLEQVGQQGIWLPREMRETVYDAWVENPAGGRLEGAYLSTGDGRSIARTRTIRITSAEVNVAVPDEEFEVHRALGLGEGSLIAHTNAAGERTLYVYLNGAEVPRETYMEQRRADALRALEVEAEDGAEPQSAGPNGATDVSEPQAPDRSTTDNLKLTKP